MGLSSHRFETNFCGLSFIVEIGKVASFSSGACLVTCGDTVVLSTVTMSGKANEGIDFFPLVVNFEERTYSSGRIPGSFSRREGKPSEAAVLTSRLIDRSIRPLFPFDLRNDVSISCVPLSLGDDCSPEIASIVASSISLSISDVPWNGPISSCMVGLVDGSVIVLPSLKRFDSTDLRMFVSSTKDKITMIEAGGSQVSEDIVLEGLKKAHQVNSKMVDFISEIQSEVGREKLRLDCDHSSMLNLQTNVEKLYGEKIKSILSIPDKIERDKESRLLRDEIIGKFSYEYIENSISESIDKIQKKIVRNWIFNDHKRVDGRMLDEIRPLRAEVGFLPRAHGSALFSRGFTQVLTTTTLGSISDCKLVDEFYDEHDKYYLHHYNFPPFSVGEAKASRAPGRREIGHGALAERALYPVIPSIEEFPYTIRLVSDVLSSNGSTSQGSVCGSTLSLMDAGVPIKEPVAGISCGLVTNDNDWITFVDIQGIEDFFGDMDFKVAGTKNGITAIQMDIKVDGLTFDIIKDALSKTRKARLKILEFMSSIISKPREHLSEYAPKILSTNVSEDKIRDVIGPGGSVVRKLTSDYNVKIDVEDDGRIYVSSCEVENCRAVMDQIDYICRDVVVGDVVNGKVTRITNFGAFIEIAPGKEGMCHISNLAGGRVERVSDVLKIGDLVTAKVIEVDNKGRIGLRRLLFS